MPHGDEVFTMSWLTVPEPGHALILTAAFRNLEKLRGYSRMSDLAGSKGVPYGDESFTWSWLTVTDPERKQLSFSLPHQQNRWARLGARHAITTSDVAGGRDVPYGDESFTWSWLTVTGTWREYEPRVGSNTREMSYPDRFCLNNCSSEGVD